MIFIGKIKEVKSSNSVMVEFNELELAAECLVVQVFANSDDIVLKQGEQVACILEQGRSVCLGAVFSNNSSPSLKTLLTKLIDILKNMDLATPSGPTKGILPNVLQKIQDFENEFKTYLK